MFIRPTVSQSEGGSIGGRIGCALAERLAVWLALEIKFSNVGVVSDPNLGNHYMRLVLMMLNSLFPLLYQRTSALSEFSSNTNPPTLEHGLLFSSHSAGSTWYLAAQPVYFCVKLVSHNSPIILIVSV